MEHHYNLEIAIAYGIEEAVIIYHFAHWIEKNAAANRNFHDGRYWTFDKSEDILKYLPEFKNKKRIEYLINKLVNNNIIMKGCYNEKVFDRTLWYTFTDEGIKLLCEHQCMACECLAKIINEASKVSSFDFSKIMFANPESEISQIPISRNANPESETAIPYNKTNTDNRPNNKTTNNNTPLTPQGDCEWSAEEVEFEKFRKAYKGSKRGHDIEFKDFCKHKDYKEVVCFLLAAYERQESIREQQLRETGWRPQQKNLKTYLNQRCWEEEVTYEHSNKTTSTTSNNQSNEIDRARQNAINTLRSRGVII